MPTSITFTDAIGAATLTNGKTSPADRFENWTHKTEPVGVAVHRQSDGARRMTRVRDDYCVSFELPGIPSKRTAGVAPSDIADRLCYHLKNGGTCVVNTGDADANSYATCSLKEGSEPMLVLSDKVEIEYTLSLQLVNTAASPARMVCRYAEQ